MYRAEGVSCARARKALRGIFRGAYTGRAPSVYDARRVKR